MRLSAVSSRAVQYAKSTRLALVASGLVLASTGCGQRPEATSETMHNADEPTRGTEAWMWTSASDSQFQMILGQLLGISQGDFLPTSHELVQRVQMWVDRIDAKLRSEHPEDLVNVPRPRAQVLKDASTNAFVAPLPVCYDMPVKVRPGNASSATTVDKVYLDLTTGEISAWPSGITCLDGEDAEDTFESIVAKFNATSPDCKFSISGAGNLTPGAQCDIGTDLAANVRAARSVAIFQTASFVTVHTGLFVSMTEEETVSVIAHELGHYYRSHTSRPETEFDFFYTMQENALPERPTPEPALRQLGEGAVLSSTLLNASEAVWSIAGARIRPELYFTAGSIVESACNDGDCPAVCEQARDYMNSEAFDDAMGTYPFTRVTSGEEAAYAAFETKTLACLAQLELVASPNTLDGSSASWDRIQDLVIQPTWPEWFGDLPPSTRRSLLQVSQLTALRLGDDAPAGADDLKAVVLDLSGELKTQDEDSVALLRQAVAQRVGQYTTEQEADDEAAEWVAEAGIDPIHVVNAMASLGRGAATSMGGMLLGEADCNALWENDWLDANGAYTFVPIGDYSEIHHSVCYRMFNLEREIAAHGHERANTQAPLLSASQWSDLQEVADDLGETVDESIDESVDDLPQVHPLLERTGILSCPYAYRYH